MDIVKQTLRFLLFWWLIFTFQRIVFSIQFFELVSADGFLDYLSVFFYSIRLDVATIGFIALITLPFWLIYQLAVGKWRIYAWRLLIIQQGALVCLIALMHSGEVNVYGDWMHKLSVRVFNHLIHPDEVFRTASIQNYLFFTFYFLCELLFGLWVMKKLFKFSSNTQKVHWVYFTKQIGAFVLLGGLSFLGARGGTQMIPIGINAAMFSNNTVLNDVSVNSAYYFIYSLRLSGKVDLDKYLEQTALEEARIFVNEMHAKKSKHDAIFLTQKRPNLIVIVLESWAADAISYTGFAAGSTPNFDRLISEGVYFNKFYAAAGTSEIGNAAIFGGYPALPQVSLTMHPEKSRKLKSLNQVLKVHGYYASYLFGGDLKYGNIGGYFLDHQFDQVLDESSFNVEKRGVLNVYDENLFENFLMLVDSSQQPFMQVAFTGSTHAPYDIPEEWNDFWKGEEAGIMNSIRYADHAIANFLDACKEKPWFSNTLFIFVSDHGRTTPNNAGAMHESFFRIPLLFWGPTIKPEFQGKEYDMIASQSDLVATLLNQMDISANDFPWSRDMLDPNFRPFAVYSSSLGYGWKDQEGDFFWHMNGAFFPVNNFPLEKQQEKLTAARKYLKVLWEEFKAIE